MYQILIVLQGSAECPTVLVVPLSPPFRCALPKADIGLLIAVSPADERSEGMSEYTSE